MNENVLTRARARLRFSGRKPLAALVSASVLATMVLGIGTASAATDTLTTPTTLSGNRTLSTTGITASGAGVTASTNLVTNLSWSQPANVSTTFDPNLVRQGRSLDPSDAYAPIVPGSMTLSWTLSNTSVSWEGFGPFDLGSPSFSASGPCELKAGGSDYVCHLVSEQVSLIDIHLGPFVKMAVGADVTVSPEGIAALRTATFGGNPGGTANLTLGESPITDSLAIPCTVGAGDSLSYQLGSLSTTQGLQVATSLLFDVGHGIPHPVIPFAELEVTFASPSILVDTTSSSIEVSSDGVTFDMGEVQPNNIPPVVDAGGPYAGNEGAAIHFDGSGSSSVCGFPTLRWDFSDGGVAFGPAPFHTFPGSGTYSGMLTATDPTGLSSTTTFSVEITNQAPVVHAGPDTTAAWGRAVAFNGSATDPGTADQPTLTYSWSFGDGSPSASGGPSTVHSYASPGNYTATLTSCDLDGGCASDSRVVHVIKRDTTTAYLGDTAAPFDTPASLSASLVDQFGQSVNGRSIAFQVGTDGPLTALTNSSGTAVKSYTPSLGAGAYTGSSSFAGDSLYNPSSSSNDFVVAPKATTMTYTGALSGGPNKTVALSAVLKDATGKPLAGRTVVFDLGTQTASAVTNSSGVAVTSLKLTQKNGSYTVAATFTPTGGDTSRYLGSTQGTTFKLQAK